MNKSNTIGLVYGSLLLMLFLNILCLVGGATAKLVLSESILIFVGIIIFTIMLILSDD